MKKKLVFALVVSAFLSLGNAAAQGLYEMKDTDSPKEETSFSSGILKAKPDPDPEPNPDPKPGPVGDALWLIVGLAGLYFMKVTYDRKKENA